MTNYLGGGIDPVAIDDFLIKEGRLDFHESRLPSESPHTFWNWEGALNTFTVDEGDEETGWRVHYKRPWPLMFYHARKPALGLRIGDQPTRVDFESADTIWARFGPFRVVVESGDFPRFQSGSVKFSHSPMRTNRENVFRLPNGYSIASSRRADPMEYGVVCPEGTWWMIGPTEEEEELSRRVLAVKIYDGPYSFQARGTDIRLGDPVPLASVSEYTIYAYGQDDEASPGESNLRGIYNEVFQGVAPQKKATVIHAEELLERATEVTGEITLKNEQLSGMGTVVYSFPIRATKLLGLSYRGSEVSMRIRCDADLGGDWGLFEGYDGKAVSDLDVEVNVVNSLSSIRVEWESLKDWEPVGRPTVDIIRPTLDPANPLGRRNKVKITGTEGEGLGQAFNLYTGNYTASADVRCFSGEAIIEVGGIEVVSWNPLDKTIRGAGDFVANLGRYEAVLTGRGNDEDEGFSYEIDRYQVAEAGEKDWMEDDLKWSVQTGQTDIKSYPADDSINQKNVPVALGEASRWRLRIEAPEDIGHKDEIAINQIRAHTLQSGESHLLRFLKWEGSGKSRIYYPKNLVSSPVPLPWIDVNGAGAISWQRTEASSPDDIELTLDGSLLSFTREPLFRNVTLAGEEWRVEVQEDRAMVYFNDNHVGTMLGRCLPLIVVHNNREDIQLDCSQGFIQMRRGMGPRFQGFEVGRARLTTKREGSVIAWGTSDLEATENLPFYKVVIGR